MNITDNFYWDQSFPLYKLEGDDSKKFLHSQTTIDAFSIKESSIVKACWLSPVGRLKAILEIQIIEEVIHFIVISGDAIEAVSGLEKVIFPSDKVRISSCDNVRRIQVINIYFVSSHGAMFCTYNKIFF